MTNKRYQLVVKKGPLVGQIYPLTVDATIIGREPLSDIIFRDPEMSRQHARFSRIESGYTITDLGSTNGTFVDGQIIPYNVPIELEANAEIMFGSGIILIYQVVSDVTSEPEQPHTIMPDKTIVSTPAPFVAPLSIEQSEEVLPSSQEDNAPITSMDEIAFTQADKPPSADDGSDEDQMPPSIDASPDTPVAENAFASPASDRFFTPPPEDELFRRPRPEQPRRQVTSPLTTPPPVPNVTDEDPLSPYAPPPSAPHIPHKNRQFAPISPAPAPPPTDKRTRTVTLTITAVLLLCCLCSAFTLFMYYWGGDWLLKQMGLL